ncbi:uncharacterized protein BDR25DRAFT_359586 [Lindgomyces ingoldianus]|uniref:Uncharacterized protein n=1 Tax=Lindgomyces ingoldianus TaxID=673940 RepID=A0ACB6QH59_9PLEO|nr:uncharacterized protein BDR25DRAFT_359586 [Lindgomyces ingoldianus]KAF2466217.1 hypothetical protein BDR25DRAFT_359586 [Lindgomyces ingoldianus]
MRGFRCSLLVTTLALGAMITVLAKYYGLPKPQGITPSTTVPFELEFFRVCLMVPIAMYMYQPTELTQAVAFRSVNYQSMFVAWFADPDLISPLVSIGAAATIVARMVGTFFRYSVTVYNAKDIYNSLAVYPSSLAGYGGVSGPFFQFPLVISLRFHVTTYAITFSRHHNAAWHEECRICWSPAFGGKQFSILLPESNISKGRIKLIKGLFSLSYEIEFLEIDPFRSDDTIFLLCRISLGGCTDIGCIACNSTINARICKLYTVSSVAVHETIKADK